MGEPDQRVACWGSQMVNFGDVAWGQRHRFGLETFQPDHPLAIAPSAAGLRARDRQGHPNGQGGTGSLVAGSWRPVASSEAPAHQGTGRCGTVAALTLCTGSTYRVSAKQPTPTCHSPQTETPRSL